MKVLAVGNGDVRLEELCAMLILQPDCGHYWCCYPTGT